jgi:hypothetical protein
MRRLPRGSRTFQAAVQVPEFYVRDSGLLRPPFDRELEDLTATKLGASWEGFALEQVLSLVDGADAYFWGTHAGAELDLLLIHKGRRYGIEFKYGDAPVMTKSLHIALEDLDLHRAWIVYPGRESYLVDKRVEVLPLSAIAPVLSNLRRTPKASPPPHASPEPLRYGPNIDRRRIEAHHRAELSDREFSHRPADMILLHSAWRQFDYNCRCLVHKSGHAGCLPSDRVEPPHGKRCQRKFC